MIKYRVSVYYNIWQIALFLKILWIPKNSGILEFLKILNILEILEILKFLEILEILEIPKKSEILKNPKNPGNATNARNRQTYPKTYFTVKTCLKGLLRYSKVYKSIQTAHLQIKLIYIKMFN